MTGLRARPLDETTWSDFAALVERHNGVWGGCWCMAFHAKGDGKNRSQKERRVREGCAHAALVYDGATCVGWCQSASFPHNATVALFERHGFQRTRRLGKHHWVVSRIVG